MTWQEEAACKGADVNAFHPTTSRSSAVALAVCEGCPVIGACGDYAATNGITAGVWGGRRLDGRPAGVHRRRCPVCRDLFLSQNGREYCGDGCRAAAIRQRGRETARVAGGGQSTAKVCGWCCGPVLAGSGAPGGGRFCCWECERSAAPRWGT